MTFVAFPGCECPTRLRERQADPWTGCGRLRSGRHLVGAVAYAVSNKQAPAWSIVVIAAIGIGLIVVAYFGGRRHGGGKDEDTQRLVADAKSKAERALDELTVATSYLSTIDDVMTGIRRAFTGLPEGGGAAALQQLERIRQLVFDAVIQGINSSRAEHIRCVYCKPHPHDEHSQVLLADHHFGHSQDVEKL